MLSLRNAPEADALAGHMGLKTSSASGRILCAASGHIPTSMDGSRDGRNVRDSTAAHCSRCLPSAVGTLGRRAAAATFRLISFAGLLPSAEAGATVASLRTYWHIPPAAHVIIFETKNRQCGECR